MSSLKLAFVGDISILHGEETTCGTALKKVFDECDYRICNFEGAVKSGVDVPIGKFGPSIIQESNSVSVLKNIGIDIACLANNHISDYGFETVKKTIELLDELYILGSA